MALGIYVYICIHCIPYTTYFIIYYILLYTISYISIYIYTYMYTLYIYIHITHHILYTIWSHLFVGPEAHAGVGWLMARAASGEDGHAAAVSGPPHEVFLGELGQNPASSVHLRWGGSINTGPQNRAQYAMILMRRTSRKALKF